MSLRTLDETFAVISAVTVALREDQVVHNLVVEGVRTYRVVVGDVALLVHNTSDPCVPSSKYEDITNKDSVPNRLTDVTHKEFGENLEANGWTKTVTKDGKGIIYRKDGAKYVLRSGARSYDGWTADYYKPGSKQASLKIRLGG